MSAAAAFAVGALLVLFAAFMVDPLLGIAFAGLVCMTCGALLGLDTTGR